MSGGSFGSPGDSPFAWVVVAGTIGTLALIGGFGFVIGDTTGAERVRESYGKQAPWRHTCLKYEDRQFADVGFFIFAGSGEVRTKVVCVHAELRR